VDYWWDADARERYWVEIRKEPGIGTALECPDHQINNDGTPGQNAWYQLVRSVRRGEIVYHYNEREQRFVGRSVAMSDAEHVGDGYIVALEDFTPIAASVDLAFMRARSEVLLHLREALAAAHPSTTIYTTFQFRGQSLYGMMSNYFAKLPRDVVMELFGPDGLAEGELPEAPDETPVRPVPGDDVDPGSALGSFLRPFKPKADSDYLANVVGGRHPRSRRHERLINNCAEWLAREGMEPMRNAAVDLGLEDPPVIIEGKTIPGGWATPVRQAVSQLYEYRYFNVASPESALIFLAEKAVPDTWVRYLEKDRQIGVMWPSSSGYHLSRLAGAALKLPD
jgi:hypothetical protein